MSGVDAGAAEYIKRIEALSEDDEVRLLDDIKTRGYDQGSFLRPAPDQLLPVSDPDVTDAIFKAVAGRPSCEAAAHDPFENVPVEAVPIPGTEPGYVVATQRCDLVRPLVTEPLVELLYTELWHEKERIDGAKKLSSRFIHIADREEGGAWVADLRRRATLAKDCLNKHDPVLAIDAVRMRKRFKLRLGQRYTRDALPRDVADQLAPLLKFLRKNATNMKLTEPFIDLLAFRKEGKVEVLAICPAGTDQRAADDAWQELEDALPDDYVHENLHEASRALPMEEVSIVFLLDGWTLDAGDISVNRKASEEHAEPTL
jgi:hypothetical protein